MVLLKSKVNNAVNNIQIGSTFHYGSIKIQKQNCTRLHKTQSTFHYGSIKISIFISMLK